jgi:hypothetical protein
MTRARKPTTSQKRTKQALHRAFNAGWWSGVNLGSSGFTIDEITEKRLPILRMFLEHERKRR